MANPLKMLKLKSTLLQIIQEVPINAPPAKVWKALMKSGWFGLGKDAATSPKALVEPRIGGRYAMERPDGSESRLLGFISHIEPNKLLRVYGPGVMTHLPTSSTLIFELQPGKTGKTTLLRFCERTYGMMTPDAKKSHTGGWKVQLGKLKALAEK